MTFLNVCEMKIIFTDLASCLPSQQLSELDTCFYYSRIMSSDPSTCPKRFGLRLSPHKKATVLYMLAHNLSYPENLTVAVRYRQRMREAIGLVLPRQQPEDPDHLKETEIFNAVFDDKLRDLIKYLWGLCRKHGVLSSPTLKWGETCAWDGRLVEAHMGTIDDAARWLDGIKAQSMVESQGETPYTAEQKGEGGGGCKTSGLLAPDATKSKPNIINSDVNVPRTIPPAAVGPVMEQLAQGIAHLSISCAGGNCPHSPSPSSSRGLNVVGQDREEEKHEKEKCEEEEEQKLEYESALGTGSMLGEQLKKQPSVPAPRGLQHSRWAAATW